MDPFKSFRMCPHILERICETFTRYDFQKAVLFSKTWQEFFVQRNELVDLDEVFYLNRGPVRDDVMFQWLEPTISSVHVNFAASGLVLDKLRLLMDKAGDLRQRPEAEMWDRYLPLVVCQSNKEVEEVLQVRDCRRKEFEIYKSLLLFKREPKPKLFS